MKRRPRRCVQSLQRIATIAAWRPRRCLPGRQNRFLRVRLLMPTSPRRPTAPVLLSVGCIGGRVIFPLLPRHPALRRSESDPIHRADAQQPQLLLNASKQHRGIWEEVQVIRYKTQTIVGLVITLSSATVARAQVHEHAPAASKPEWHVMQDAIAFGLFNHQGGPRGGDELRVPNWWMGMFSRKVKSSDLAINTMFSLDALTVGKKGYRELFQVGEAFEGQPLIDYQHPHDVFMQLSVVWRIPVSAKTAVTLAGGPSAEPAIGPVAFMHRASAMENPISPLSHHTFDSTHIAFGVVTAAIDRGAWTVEASAFNGREPDENRWDLDLGTMNSYAGRVWFRPRAEWEFQASAARLIDPEAFGHGNIVRSTASASWLKRERDDFTAITVAYGVNNGEDANRHSVLAEATRRIGSFSPYGRLEFVEVETGLVLDDHSIAHSVKDAVGSLTLGALRELPRWGRFESGIGAAATFYRVPGSLKAAYGTRPVSFQVFLRLRPRAGSMGRMWNMHMIKPMNRTPVDPHAGHQMD